MSFVDMFVEMFSDWPKLDLGEGAFYAIFGFLFVFAGIALLIGILMLVGFLMTKLNGKKGKKEREKAVPVPKPQAEQPADGEISPAVVAAITAAVAVCLEEEGGKCEFVVKRIRRVR